MKYILYEKLFTEKALKSGYSQDNIDKCLSYSKLLIENNLPIIYNSNHLASLVGYKHSYITRAIISTTFFYRHFKIKKKNGQLRPIAEPLPSLKEIQNFILEQILYKQKVSKFCKSYVPKKNIKEYLKYHVNEKTVLTLDLENFFSSIKFKLVHDLFMSFNYSHHVSWYLACICTYVEKQKDFDVKDRFLAQGAATSPYLSNLILKDFDDLIGQYCTENKIAYTRYADDLAFSGDSLDENLIINLVKKEIDRLGLKLNYSKKRFMKQNEPQIISGIVVNKKMQLPKNKRNDIRQIMYYIQKHTLKSHLEYIGETRENYLTHLLGRIQYAINLNPDDLELQKYKAYLLNEIRNKH